MDFSRIAEIEEIIPEKIENKEIVVSIWCITYNHKEYIKDALEGFISQKTNYKYEIVVFDDASTDGTSEIVRLYAQKYPELIKAYLAHKNTYNFLSRKMMINEYMKKILNGKYIALCEGDDYWVCEDKLQVQIEYMENHPDCVLTGHDAIQLNCETGEKRNLGLLKKETDITVGALISGKEDITTASIVARREMWNMEDFFFDVGILDYPLKLYCASKGKMHYFNKVMSVYRYLRAGSWSSSQKNSSKNYIMRWVNIFAFLIKYDEYTKEIYRKDIENAITERLNAILLEFHNMSIEKFRQLCETCDEECFYKNHKFYTILIRLFNQYYNNTFLDERVRAFVQKKQYLFIWGAGEYGKMMAEQLSNNGIDFQGFIVSDNQDAQKRYMGKQVWKISELPYEKEKVGILIAVRIQLMEEILFALKSSKLNNYIYPFVFQYNDI